MKTLALASAVLLFPMISNAQQATDPKWNAWLGCWELVVENARDAATRPSPSRRTLPQSAHSSRPQVCVEPSGNGVTLTTRVANQSAIQQTIVADGADHRSPTPSVAALSAPSGPATGGSCTTGRLACSATRATAACRASRFLA